MPILNFLEVAVDYKLAPEEAIKFYENKGLRPSFDWKDMIGKENDAAFTVAKMMNTDLLKTVHDKMTRAIADGTTFQDFANELVPQLQKAGWWGKQTLIHPVTGDIIEGAQTGSLSRLENIFRTNMQSAYSVGEWDRIQEQVQRMPYLMYDAVDDSRTRPEHAKQDEKVHRVDSDYWNVWFPPNGWMCRCGTIQLDADDLREYGLEVSDEETIETRLWTNPNTGEEIYVPVGIDPGWSHNPGQSRNPVLLQNLNDKTLTADLKLSTPIEPRPRTMAEVQSSLAERFPSLEFDLKKGKNYEPMQQQVMEKLEELGNKYDIHIDDERFTTLTINNRMHYGQSTMVKSNERGHIESFLDDKRVIQNKIFFVNSGAHNRIHKSKTWSVQTKLAQREQTTVHEFGHLIYTPGTDTDVVLDAAIKRSILNSSEYRQYQTFKAEFNARKKAAFLPGGNDEVDKLRVWFDDGALSQYEFKEQAEAIVDDVMLKFIGEHQYGNLFISEYAFTSDAEMFAEAFVEHYANQNASNNPLVTLIGQFFDENFKR